MIRIENSHDPEGAFCTGTERDRHPERQLRVIGRSDMAGLPVLTQCEVCKREYPWGPARYMEKGGGA